MKRLNPLRNRWREGRRASGTMAVVAGILAVLLATLAAFAFVPGLRETRMGRALRFQREPPPPEPAVPPGALGTEMEQQEASGVAGTITIDQTTAETLGLQTATVEYQTPETSLRTTGRVMADERRTATVTTKFEGWVDETYGDFEGQEIRKGEPLYTVYSPELLASQQEYLIALRSSRSFEKSEFDVVRASGASLVESARRRLALFDMSPAQIAEVERTGKALRAVTMYAPASGVVVERKAFPGMRVEPSMTLYMLADLSSIWVEADVFEVDLAGVRVGITGEIVLPWGETRSARVTYVNPMVDPQTRTAKVRLELPNPGLRLKPGMFVDVSLRPTVVPQLAVPRDAVLDTGARKLVLVAGDNNQFMLREITTGTEGQELTTVLSGLSPGERVARNIQFLIDSETPLREAVDRLSSAPAGGQQAPPASNTSMPNMPGMSGTSGGHDNQ